jgi:tape measure domain-containing protein
MATQKIRYDIEAAVSGGSEVNALASSLEGLAGTLEGDLKVQALASAAALRQLGEKQGAIESFRGLKVEVQSTADRLRDAQLAAQQLGQKLAASEGPTRAQAGQMQKLRDAVRSTKDELQRKTVALDQSRATLNAAGVDTQKLAQSEREVRQAIAAARGEVQQLVPAYAAAGRTAVESGRQQAKAAGEAGGALRGLGQQLRTIQSIAVTALGGSFVGGLVGDVARTADEYNNLAARIKLATGEGEAFESAMAAVTDISLRTNTALNETGTLFARLTDAGKSAGLSAADAQARSLKLTEGINQALAISGASAQTSAAAITQLTQGLQSGVLRGEEFNSVSENGARLARALADGLGVTSGELRKMANEGRLTSDVVGGALLSQLPKLKAEYESLPPTVGRAIQNLSTSWTLYVGQVDKATGASTAAAQAITAVASNLDDIAGIATRAGAVLVAALAIQAAGAVRTYAAEALAGKTATSLLALEMSKIPTALKITVAFAGFELGYQIGEMLRENSEYARKLGVATVGLIEGNLNALRGLKEAGAAIFTDDTVAAAIDRYKQRNDELRVTLQQMWTDAEKAPAAIGAAGAAAAAGVGQIAAAAVVSTTAVVDQSAKAVAALSKQTEAVEALKIGRVTDAQVALSGLEVQRQLADQSEAMARLLGDETAQRKARIAQLEIDIRISAAKVAVARAEAEGTIAVAQAKLTELKASQQLTPVKEAEIQASIRLAQAKLKEAEAGGKAVGLLEKQLQLLKTGAGAADQFGASTRGAADAQRQFGNSTNSTNQSLVNQAKLVKQLAEINSRYSRPGEAPGGNGKDGDPGRGSIYSRPGNDPRNSNGQTQAEFQREQKLKGQGALDMSLQFDLLAKLQNRTLTSEDVPALKSVIAVLKENQKTFDSISPGLNSLQALADDRKWQNAIQGFQQFVRESERATSFTASALNRERFDGGAFTGSAATPAAERTVNVRLTDARGQTRTVQTSEAGAAALLETLRSASLTARG